MIQIKVGTNTKKTVVNTSVTMTPAALLEQEGVNMSGATAFLNGAPLSPLDYSKTFAELGVADESSAMLIAAVKADSAVTA